MKKIFLIISLVLIFGNNYIFAENDISKHSQKDREQCLLMDVIHYNNKAPWYFKKYIDKNKDIYKKYFKLYDKKYSNVKLHKKQFNVFNKKLKKLKDRKKPEDFTGNPNKYLDYFTIWERDGEGVARIYFNEENKPLGILKLGSSGFDEIYTGYNDYDYYNVGYFFDFKDYWFENYPNEKLFPYDTKIVFSDDKLSNTVFAKEEILEDVSYIKTKNCFVEEYYIKQEN